ncbi:hypothetical protein [Streptomyces sp. FH025]|uniref:hypothetical protein n=1 Tax=Streptomyces sp. FH025 TaxID=2815937 RepID=UPI001A9EA896|nr:hypothetical protein [Streptomyces sp. FH025]MBO1415102.1 hypothetical protein [Streptomyces sp. FH025]
MADIRHNHDETARLAKRMGEHADHLETTAGGHTHHVATRLKKVRGKDSLANAAAHGAEQIMNVIRNAEKDLHRHLRVVQKGLEHTSSNHHQNDKRLATMLANIHNRSETQVKALRADAGRAQGPDPSKPAVTVPIQWKQSMDRSAFAWKAQSLAGASRRGETYRATSKVMRDTEITKQYKGALIHLIYKNNKDNPELAKKAADVAHKMQPDHVIDLQAGGLDHWQNLRMLEKETNFDVGTKQLWQKIRPLPDGTPIKIKVKWK